jgi:hypothetical protein
MYSYVSGSANTAENNFGGGPPGLAGNPGGLFNPRNIRALASTGEPCVGVRPFFQINQPNGTNALAEIDTFWLRELTESTPSVRSILDPNFTAADDNRYWFWDTASYPEIDREVGGGLNGSNCLRWTIDGLVTNNIALVDHRERIDLNAGDTIIVRLTYKITGVTSIDATNTLLQVRIGGYAYDTNDYSPRNYVPVGNDVVQSKAIADLDDDGDWHVWTFTFSSVQSGDLGEADMARLRIAVVPQASDDFTIRIGRARWVQA